MSNMDEGRKRALAIVAGILVARHMKTAEDLFGGSQGSPRTDAMVAAAVQWAERIMSEIDRRWPTAVSNRGNQK
jgi:broad specificity phosphatase PhoE